MLIGKLPCSPVQTRSRAPKIPFHWGCSSGAIELAAWSASTSSRRRPGFSNYRVDYDRELNEEQREVVLAGSGPILVIAGAGSGKTRTLVYRVARLIESGHDPSRILLLTFTNKAAREMLRRVETLRRRGHAPADGRDVPLRRQPAPAAVRKPRSVSAPTSRSWTPRTPARCSRRDLGSQDPDARAAVSQRATCCSTSIPSRSTRAARFRMSSPSSAPHFAELEAEIVVGLPAVPRAQARWPTPATTTISSCHGSGCSTSRRRRPAQLSALL